MLDADLGLANLDVVLNLFPKITLHDVFTGKAALEDAILPAPGGFSVLLAGSGLVEYSRLTPEVRDQLLEVIETVAPRFDRILLDTGAGISDVVLYAVSLADEVLVVATPEPTSLTDAYATIKVLATQQQRRGDRGWSSTRSAAPARAASIRGQLQQVVDRYVTPLLQDPTQPVKLELLGEIPTDPAVREAVQKRQLLLEALPGCAGGARASAAVADKLRAMSDDDRSGSHAPSSWLGGEAARARAGRPLLRPDGPGAGLRRHPRACTRRTLDGSRDKLFWFLCGWLGGPQHYVERFGHPRLRARHLPFAIGIARARPVAGLHAAGDARAAASTRRWRSGWPRRSSTPPTGCATAAGEWRPRPRRTAATPRGGQPAASERPCAGRLSAGERAQQHDQRAVPAVLRARLREGDHLVLLHQPAAAPCP